MKSALGQGLPHPLSQSAALRCPWSLRTSQSSSWVWLRGQRPEAGVLGCLSPTSPHLSCFHQPRGSRVSIPGTSGVEVGANCIPPLPSPQPLPNQGQAEGMQVLCRQHAEGPSWAPAQICGAGDEMKLEIHCRKGECGEDSVFGVCDSRVRVSVQMDERLRANMCQGVRIYKCVHQSVLQCVSGCESV